MPCLTARREGQKIIDKGIEIKTAIKFTSEIKIIAGEFANC